jgi:serine/threonine protein kinase
MREIGQGFAHYTIEALLGRGGMGEVYRAFDTKLHRRVALKLLLVDESTREEARLDAVARIIREARAAAAVEHPNKVSIFELGEVDGTPYLAMEYIAGSTLRVFVGERRAGGALAGGRDALTSPQGMRAARVKRSAAPRRSCVAPRAGDKRVTVDSVTDWARGSQDTDGN